MVLLKEAQVVSKSRKLPKFRDKSKKIGLFYIYTEALKDYKKRFVPSLGYILQHRTRLARYYSVRADLDNIQARTQAI